jgi:hypothetical protein
VRNRNQRRRKAILPLKLVSLEDKTTYLGHTLDISASGARVIVTCNLARDLGITVEYKHHRANAKVVWCRPVKGRKYEYELGVKMQNSGSDFWGISLALREPDQDADELSRMPFSKVMSLISPKHLVRMS